MLESVIGDNIARLVAEAGDFGVFAAMFLESSIVPIPSEVILMGAGAMGIPLTSILIYGSLGSTLGAMCGYALGRYAALPVILKFGKFVLIKPHHIAKAEAFAKKYGVWSVLIGRVLPVIPFKVFSIAAGITNIRFWAFVVCTLLGVMPRILVLAYFGTIFMKYKQASMLIIIFAIVIFAAVKITKSMYETKKSRAISKSS